MIKVLIEYFTHIDEVNDFIQLWPTICHYFEIDLGWNMASSFFISGLVTLLIIAIPVFILASISSAIIKFIKNI